MDDEYEKLRLKSELEQLKCERESQKKSICLGLFLAVWLVPLLGMLVVQGDDPPKTAGPAFPVVGQISIWGMWFLGVPLATFLFRLR